MNMLFSLFVLYFKLSLNVCLFPQELLGTTRIIISTDFRRGFVGQIEELFDENLLLGPGQPEVLRPLAASVIADLVHNTRDSLSMSQLMRIVQIFSAYVYDMRLPVATQAISVRILLSLLERAAMLKATVSQRATRFLSRYSYALYF
jgi:hypothetical protein